MNTPFLGLVGIDTNTELVFFDGYEYKVLGMDIDMPLGSAFNSLSKFWGLSLRQMEECKDFETINYPIPMINHKGLDFSFAGAYYYTLQQIYPKNGLPKNTELLSNCFSRTNHEGMKVLAASFSKAAIFQLQKRVEKAILWVKNNYKGVNVFVFVI